MQLSPQTASPVAEAHPLASNKSFLAFAALLVLAACVLARPYIGLRHDGVLYLGQVLLRWWPDVMSRDIFFEFGSQDRYTIAADMLAALYRHVSVAHAQMVFVALTQFAVLGIVLAWLRRNLRPQECVLGLVAICIMSHNYGGWQLFAFSERFITGRTMAEPVALLGLLLVDRHKIIAGLIILALSLVFHPLIGAGAIAVAWVLLVSRDPRWLWALAGVPVGFLLGAADVAPFDGLLKSYDADWWSAVMLSNSIVLVTSWPREDLATFAFDLVVLWVGARVFPNLSHLLRAVAVATLLLFAVSAVATELLQNVLLTQLQLWRVHWIARLLSIAILPALLWRTWRRGDGIAQILAMAVAVSAIALNVRFSSSTMLVLWAGLALWLHVARPVVSPLLLRIARIATAFALVGISVLILREVYQQLASTRGSDFGIQHIVLLLVTMPMLSLPAAAALMRVHANGGMAAHAAVGLVAVGALVGMVNWDQRTPWTRHLESSIHQEHPFSRHMPPTAQVLWWQEAGAVWTLLHRPSYFSDTQAAGLLFNRGTGIEIQRRNKVLGVMQMQQRVCALVATLNPDEPPSNDCWPTVEAVQVACSAERGPDFIVTHRRLEQGFVAEWTFHPTGMTWYLHDCKQIH